MNKRIKELAEQAGFECWKDEPYRPQGQVIDWASNYDEELEKFAELVRADEREACAKLCDHWPYGRDDIWSLGQAIRARGEKPPVKTYAGGKPNYCTPEVPCKTDPRAPHGFDRTASHSADRYVCECEGWEPDDVYRNVDNVNMSEKHIHISDKSIHEPVYAFRRKGLDDFCTCDKRRYDELADKPNLFEVTVFYTAPVDAVNMTPDRVDETAKDGHEPVAWMKEWDWDGHRNIWSYKPAMFYEGELQPLYTAPPKREWVGLTDEDKVAIYQKADDENWHDQPLLEAVEAKLKEKNS